MERAVVLGIAIEHIVLNGIEDTMPSLWSERVLSKNPCSLDQPFQRSVMSICNRYCDSNELVLCIRVALKCWQEPVDSLS